MEEEANYDDDEEAEPEDEEDDNAADEEAEQEVQPKQAKKRRRGKAGRGRGKPPAQDQEERRAAAETIGRSILTAKMKKTRMCDFHKEGRCKYGSDCAFAHDESELQKAPDLKKTRLCRAFLQRKCNDADCKFAHGEQELRASDICFKTALCTWFEKGNCQSGSQCRFAHGEEELRDDPDAKAAADERGSGLLKAQRMPAAQRGCGQPRRFATAVDQPLQHLWVTLCARFAAADAAAGQPILPM
eukprot:CAMPEP_0181466462 /NCGR_PEP_ID=MMETSP1110-20121109/36475_1 /TAXON_ID=174948 /ORGANISM="Symbiodinium sp., Strain CCMP421" /LENGTH=243 /DNA_ID=CAMNT_0023591257 /DNA_START=98 /DNA_END=827 /DNA_ORIENTATION=-